MQPWMVMADAKQKCTMKYLSTQLADKNQIFYIQPSVNITMRLVFWRFHIYLGYLGKILTYTFMRKFVLCFSRRMQRPSKWLYLQL